MDNPTTEEAAKPLAGEPPTVSSLRQKLGQKAKQEDATPYAHFKRMGLIYL